MGGADPEVSFDNKQSRGTLGPAMSPPKQRCPEGCEVGIPSLLPPAQKMRLEPLKNGCMHHLPLPHTSSQLLPSSPKSRTPLPDSLVPGVGPLLPPIVCCPHHCSITTPSTIIGLQAKQHRLPTVPSRSRFAIIPREPCVLNCIAHPYGGGTKTLCISLQRQRVA